jgi:cell division protein YceG involved in septum cleavage
VPAPSDQDGGRRTAKEREQARLERERRRIQRRGEAMLAEPEAPAAEPARDGQSQAASEDLHATQAWDVADALAAADSAAKGPAANGAAKGPAANSAAKEPAANGAVKEPPANGKSPLPPARVGGRGVRPPMRPAPDRRAQAGRAQAGRPRRGGEHSLRARAGAVGALLLLVIVVWLAVLLIQHLSGSKSTPAPQAAKAPAVTVVIPEGESRPQIAAIARKDGLTGSYMQASKRSSAIQPKRFGTPAGTRNLEGFLFPATYEMPVHGNVKGLVERQLEAFQERFGPEEEHRAKLLRITPYQMLIVASMIEREAYLAKDRPLVAAVIYNRLRLGMPLGIDSTIRFALNDYSKPLTEAQLSDPSPYNTRLHRGLPPTPISNPGMEAIEAASHPSHVGYLFYVDGADGCGDLLFSDTEAEFEVHKRAYDEALAANGGRAPTCKHK